MVAKTPTPPYYAVIFTSLKTNIEEGYAQMADWMLELAQQQDGYLGMETAREELGITVSYWRDLASIKKWKQHADHQWAQARGRAQWYRHYKTRIAKVERDYEFYQ